MYNILHYSNVNEFKQTITLQFETSMREDRGGHKHLKLQHQTENLIFK